MNKLIYISHWSLIFSSYLPFIYLVKECITISAPKSKGLWNENIIYSVKIYNVHTQRIANTEITRYDYNLMIMKSPKPVNDTIYPHIKFWWYRTMLNFYPLFLCRVLAAILKMADILKILKMQNCSSNGDLSLCQI
jgi:hypothetical protein